MDLDAYSTADYGDEAFGDRDPTLSFVTSSTVDSVAGIPQVAMAYSRSSRITDAKGEQGPNVSMRSTSGRATTYSSAESSTGSGAFSYHTYSDHIYTPSPPLPQIPDEHNSSDTSSMTADYPIPRSNAERSHAHQIRPPLSPSHSFTHRPWKRDVVNRLRSDSVSSAFTAASTSTDDSATSSSQIPLSDAAYHYAYDDFTLPYEQEQAEPEALAMIKEGREKLLNMEKIDAMGGGEALNDSVICSLAGVTHLLLPSCGSRILDLLPRLLSVLAPSLVVLDLSDNKLSLLPDSLQCCTSLEELNLSGNPLRLLPQWMGSLSALRVLVVDGCGLTVLPQGLCHLHHLHTICVRRNKLMCLPPWLCLLSHLETLKVDGNPFTPEWAQIVPPILGGPLPSMASSSRGRNAHHRHLSINNGIRTPVSMVSLESSDNEPNSASSSTLNLEQSSSGIASSSASHSTQLVSALSSIAEDNLHSAPLSKTHAIGGSLTSPELMAGTPHSHGSLRKMRSAGALLRSLDQPTSNTSSSFTPTRPVIAERFATEGRRAASAMGDYQEEPQIQPGKLVKSSAPRTTAAPTKTGRWGFLRKMSMNRLRPDKEKITAIATSASDNLKSLPPLPPIRHQHSDPIQHVTVRPRMVSTVSAVTLPSRKIADFEPLEFGQMTSCSTPSALTMPVSGLPYQSSPIRMASTGTGLALRGKRRSFLPIDGPPLINVQIPTSAFSTMGTANSVPQLTTEVPIPQTTILPHIPAQPMVGSPVTDTEHEERYTRGLDTIKLILRDLHDLSRRSVMPHDGSGVMSNSNADSSYAASTVPSDHPGSPLSSNRDSFINVRQARRPTLEGDASDLPAAESEELNERERSLSLSGKKFKDDKSKRTKCIHELWETERTYVRNLGELVAIYVRPASKPVNQSKSVVETVVPAAERKIVFGGVESILAIHRDNFLPALENVLRQLVENGDDEKGTLSIDTAYSVGEVFRTYIAYMKQYSTYITNFDNALARMKTWSLSNSSSSTPVFSGKSSATNVSVNALAAGMGAVSLSAAAAQTASGQSMSSNQRKRVKNFLKKAREHPMHSQISLESYLLLPIQRIPRYKLLLTELVMCTPTRSDGLPDALDDALTEISSLASLMNEEKRDADSRLRLLDWQKRFTNSGRSPLVQPHRRLVMEGPLTLSRIVKKASTFVECETVVEGDGDHTIIPGRAVIPVDYVMPESVEREVMLILCSDMMVLATDRGEGWDGHVNVFNVLRMTTMIEPASLTGGNILRVVDNSSIYYFRGVSRENTLQWCRAINSARR